MKFPISWIKDYVDISNISIKEFADGMTMSGTMVEGVEKLGEGIENVVLGRVLEVKPHPDADKLVVCQVDVGKEKIQIVTGSPSMQAGQLVPVAIDGAKLPFSHKDGKPLCIKTGELRGVLSQGMMCGQDELLPNVPKTPTVWFLEDYGYPLGTDIKEVLGLNDTIIEVELTANRPDCQAIISIAREVKATFEKKPLEYSVDADFSKLDKNIDITILDRENCPRYSALKVENIKIEPSPKWLVDRLNKCGIRAISNIVDITNYVMLELGQPLHAFDITKLKGEKIIVRKAKESETITTLDEIERNLLPSDLVICDEEKPVAIAGIMGGEHSGIDDNTKTVIFESANFNGANVRKTSKRIGLRTDASVRYEKGVDVNLTAMALARVAQLLQELNVGEIVSFVDDVKELPTNTKIKFEPEKINKYLGTDISTEFMKNALRSVNVEIENGEAIIPSWRLDMTHMQDLSEEIARLYGYNNIASAPILGSAGNAGLTKEQKIEKEIAKYLTASSLYEILTYSFIDPADYAKINEEVPDVVRIRNPLGAEHSIMRTQALTSMLSVLETNKRNGNEKANLYEIATLYLPTNEELPHERKVLTIGSYGGLDFYSVKGIVQGLIEKLGIKPFTFQAGGADFYHPYQKAEIVIRGKVCGSFGKIHPQIAKNYDLKDTFYAELDLEQVVPMAVMDKKYKALPKFPSIQRDIAIIVDKDLEVGEIEKVISSVRSPIFESFKLFDVYVDDKLGDNKKSVAYNFVFRSLEKTLTDDEANELLVEIKAKLHDKLRIEERA